MKLRNKLIAGTLMLCISSVSINCTALASGQELIRVDDRADSSGDTYDYVLSATDTYNTGDESEYDFGFEKTVDVDGLSYVLDHIEYEKVNEYESEFGTTEIAYKVTKESAVEEADKDSFEPETKTIKQNGYSYEYEDVEFEESGKNPVTMSSYLTSEIVMEFDAGNYPAEVSYEYEGKSYSLPYKDYEILNDGWYDYNLSGTILDYDAATYELGGIVLQHDDNGLNLTKDELISFVAAQGYSSEVYKPSSAEYAGEPYTDADGRICRDYVIKGQRYGKTYQINYEKTYDITKYTAIVTYTMSDKDKGEIEKLKNSYKVTAYAFYNLDEPKTEPATANTKKETLSVPAKVAIGIGIVLGIAAIATLVVYLVRGGRKKTEYMSDREAKDEFKNM